MSVRPVAVILAVVGVCLGTAQGQTVDPDRVLPSGSAARIAAGRATSVLPAGQKSTGGRTSNKPLGRAAPVVAYQSVPSQPIAPLQSGAASLGPSGPVLQAPGPLATSPGTAPQLGAGACGQPAWDCWLISSRGCTVKDARSRAACLQFAYFHSSRQAVRMDEASFMQSLDPNRPLCIYIHGGYYKFGDVIHEARQIQNWISSGGPQPLPQLVCFTWPSSTAIPVPPVDIPVLGRQSAIHGVFLADFVNRLPSEQAVSLLGHSYGARTSASALHVLAGGVIEETDIPSYGAVVPRRLRAVLMAPAIDHHWLNPGERYGLAAVGVEKILVLKNTIDPLLSLYPVGRPFSGRALGHLGLDNCDRFQLQCLSSRIDEFDTIRYTGLRHNTDGFYNSPELSRIIAPYLSFTPLPAIK